MIQRPQLALLAAFVVALTATAGSLVLSEALHLVPCALCWYQRAMMYPLVIILGAGFWRRDLGVAAYALPLALLGFMVAAYHSLLQWGIVPEPLVRCVATVPCSVKQVNLLGFITIPFLSSLSFAAIIACLWLARRAGPAIGRD